LFSFPTSLGDERLDRLDRRILEAICGHGREGQGFNKLVSEVKPFVSRSTFAVRVKRLERLGFVERFPDAKEKRVRRTRGMPPALMIMRIVVRMRQQCVEIERSIVELDDGRGVERLSRDLEVINRRIEGVFGLVGTYAVLFGEGAAGDLILPMVVEDFKKVFSALLAFLGSHPEFAGMMAKERLALVPTDVLGDDFKYAFGMDIRDALPGLAKFLNKPKT
jgi:DNA-binding Lrp family transcriptional regulator